MSSTPLKDIEQAMTAGGMGLLNTAALFFNALAMDTNKPAPRPMQPRAATKAMGTGGL